MTEEKEPIYVRYVKLTPKGKEILDHILSILEENPDIVTKGLDQMVEDMQSSDEHRILIKR